MAKKVETHKVTKADGVKVLVALGWAGAAKLDDAAVAGKLEKLPVIIKKATKEPTDAKVKKLIKAILVAVKEGKEIELLTDGDDKPKAAGKKTGGKGAKPGKPNKNDEDDDEDEDEDDDEGDEDDDEDEDEDEDDDEGDEDDDEGDEDEEDDGDEDESEDEEGDEDEEDDGDEDESEDEEGDEDEEDVTASVAEFVSKATKKKPLTDAGLYAFLKKTHKDCVEGTAKGFWLK